MTISAGGVASDLSVAAAITGEAAVNLNADDSISFSAAGSVTASGTGTVSITADALARHNVKLPVARVLATRQLQVAPKH